MALPGVVSKNRLFSAIYSHLFAFSLVRLTASLFMSIATHVDWGRKGSIKALNYLSCGYNSCLLDVYKMNRIYNKILDHDWFTACLLIM